MEKKPPIIIIQARLNSKRLPGKVLKKIGKQTVLEHIFCRLKPLKLDIVVATTNKLSDKKIVNLCVKNKIRFFCGSEKDVLKRFYSAASKFNAETIIRVTADCPFIDYKIIKQLMKFYKAGSYDHAGLATGAGVANLKYKKFPDGLDAECFSFKALQKANKRAKKKFDREHVTPYIWKNKKKFKVGILESKKDYSHLRVTLDNLEDFHLINKIYKKIKFQGFGLNDLDRLSRSNPKLFKINEKYIGKEKY